jgi:hypothetical protein
MKDHQTAPYAQYLQCMLVKNPHSLLKHRSFGFLHIHHIKGIYYKTYGRSGALSAPLDGIVFIQSMTFCARRWDVFSCTSLRALS